MLGPENGFASARQTRRITCDLSVTSNRNGPWEYVHGNRDRIIYNNGRKMYADLTSPPILLLQAQTIRWSVRVFGSYTRDRRQRVDFYRGRVCFKRYV